MNQMTNQFARMLLKRVGAPPTWQNIRFLVAWGTAEGTAAKWNPLGTTRDMPGATQFNSVGVRNFKSLSQGVEATARALENGYYGHILTLMRSGTARAEAMGAAVAASPWGTHEGVLRVLHSGPVSVPAGSVPVPESQPRRTVAQAVGPVPVGLRLNLAHSLMSAASSGNAIGLLGAIAALKAFKTKPIPTVPVGDTPTTAQNSPSVNIGATGRVSLASTANIHGRPIKPYVLTFASRVAGIAGEPLTIGTGTNHNEYVSGTGGKRQSAHYTGNAVDIPALGAGLTKIGQAALIAAGMNPARARKIKGGLFNIGHWQIIFNINLAQGGNHYNHLHIGWRA